MSILWEPVSCLSSPLQLLPITSAAQSVVHGWRGVAGTLSVLHPALSDVGGKSAPLSLFPPLLPHFGVHGVISVWKPCPMSRSKPVWNRDPPRHPIGRVPTGAPSVICRWMSCSFLQGRFCWVEVMAAPCWGGAGGQVQPLGPPAHSHQRELGRPGLLDPAGHT